MNEHTRKLLYPILPAQEHHKRTVHYSSSSMMYSHMAHAPDIQTSVHTPNVNQSLHGRHSVHSHRYVHTTAGILS